MRQRVYDYIAHCPDGATRHEISAALDMGLPTVCARCRELVLDGILYERGSRSTPSGRPAGVLRAKET
jgi:hypothetical protein